MLIDIGVRTLWDEALQGYGCQKNALRLVARVDARVSGGWLCGVYSGAAALRVACGPDDVSTLVNLTHANHKALLASMHTSKAGLMEAKFLNWALNTMKLKTWLFGNHIPAR